MLADIEQEAQRIVAAGESQGMRLRLLGGLAIRLHSPSATHRALERSYPDIDLATNARSQMVESLIAGLGYKPDQQFNLLNGSSRLLFYDESHGRQVDVFVSRFEMCHRLPITDRLALESLTLPLAELLLTKLQIVQLNEKDLRDVSALLLDHPVGNSDSETINSSYIAQLLANDWGLWRTITGNLANLRAFADSSDLDESQKITIRERVESLLAAIEAAPKSFKWKTRAAVGERKRWYELPEEVQRG
jgi:hypothetical protein